VPKRNTGSASWNEQLPIDSADYANPEGGPPAAGGVEVAIELDDISLGKVDFIEKHDLWTDDQKKAAEKVTEFHSQLADHTGRQGGLCLPVDPAHRPRSKEVL
jgi:hypothetical protein